MRSFKAFTLVELIVVIAIFGIIMAGIMKMAEPITESSATYRVLNDQKNIENSISKYIGENVRYANNLVIIESGAAASNGEGAIRQFAKLDPKNSAKKSIFANPNNPTADEMKQVDFICFDGLTNYNYVSVNHNGRIIASIPQRPSNTFTDTNLSTDGSTGSSTTQYLVFGNDYYAQGDYYMSAEITSDGILKLKVDSDYSYNPASAKFNSTSSNPTETSFALRNHGVGDFMYGMYNEGATAAKTTPCTSTRSSGKKLFFVFTKDTATYFDGEGSGGSGGGSGPVTPPGTSGGGNGNGGVNSGNGQNGNNNGGSNNGGGNGGNTTGSPNSGNGNTNNSNSGGNNGGNNGNNNNNNNGGSTTQPYGSGRNGAADVPNVSVDRGNSVASGSMQNNHSYNVYTDSSIWSATQNGDKITFVSPEYGTITFQMNDWGKPVPVLNQCDNTAKEKFRLDWSMSPNNMDIASQVQDSNGGIGFWSSYGISFDCK